MKKHGMLNSEIIAVLASLGHTDTIVIADCGLPIPASVQKIDISTTLGHPTFQEVCDMLFDEMLIESCTVASEITQHNAPQFQYIQRLMQDIPVAYIAHEEFKRRTHAARAIIRTGEATPYSNIIFHAGVRF